MKTFSHFLGTLVLCVAFAAGVSAQGAAATSDSISITAPIAQSWQIGTTHDITWTSAYNSKTLFSIQLKSGTTTYSIASKIKNTGRFSWKTSSKTVDDKTIPAGTYQVIICKTGTTVCGSNGPLMLVALIPEITVTDTGNENWLWGSIQDVQWKTANINEGEIMSLSLRSSTTDYLLNNHATNTARIFYWKVGKSATGTVVPSGQYSVIVCNAKKTSCGSGGPVVVTNAPKIKPTTSTSTKVVSTTTKPNSTSSKPVSSTSTSTKKNTLEDKPDTEISAVCVDLHNDLEKGSATNKIEDVKVLQTFLLDQKIYSGEINGIFGPLTKAAVKLFQEKNNITQSGYVGPKTRALIHSVSCKGIKS